MVSGLTFSALSPDVLASSVAKCTFVSSSIESNVSGSQISAVLAKGGLGASVVLPKIFFLIVCVFFVT